MDADDILALEAKVADGKLAKSLLYGLEPGFGHMVLELTVTAFDQDGRPRRGMVSTGDLTEQDKRDIARIIRRTISAYDNAAEALRSKWSGYPREVD